MASRSSSPSENVQALVRGLAVIEAFDSDHRLVTLSDIARRVGINRAAARRLLHTLVDLGYLGFDGERFRLRPRVLALGFSYLASMSIWDVVRPHLQELVASTQESCSAAVLEGRDIVHVVRYPARRRLMSVAVEAGHRLPAHATSMGRMLLSGLDDSALDAYLALAPFEACTSRTVTDPGELRAIVERTRLQGYSVVDGEVELGLRSVAAAIRDRDRKIVAAFCLSTLGSSESRKETLSRLLPAIRLCAERIDEDLRRLGEPNAARECAPAR